MINAVALDDEPLALELLDAYCAKSNVINLQKTFTKPTEALKYLRKFPVDLLFLDIRMPSISGLDFHKNLPPHTMVIFTTAYSQYAVEGFNLNAVDYLLKPFTFERFEQAVERAKKQFNQRHDASEKPQPLLIRADYSLIKIEPEHIVYIQGLDDYLKIYLTNRKPVVVRMTMKSMLSKLPPNDFVRVHRSYIVPLNRIESVRNKTVHLAGVEIPIGSSYEENFFGVFKG